MPTDTDEAYRLGVAAWCKCKNMSLHGAGKLTDLANHLLNFVSGFFARQLDADQLIADVPIKSVAVWDTVGSLGIPAYAGDKRFDVFRFVDTKLSNKVQHGFHAMAVDELRADFPVTAWDSRAGVKQVWFVGAHADVGGGYTAQESRLSDIALEWMMKQLAEVGVRLATPLTYKPEPLIAPAIHQPWSKGAVRAAATLATAGHEHGHDSRQRAAAVAGGCELSAASAGRSRGEPGQVESRTVRSGFSLTPQ